MAQLQTKVIVPTPGFQISHNHSVALFGSCFADTIGNRLNRFKFNSVTNPFGVLYNPASIAQSINSLFEKQLFIDTDLDFYNDLWFSFRHHTLFSSPDKETCLTRVNESFLKAKESINTSSHVVITLGTAWTYRLIKTGEIVANCHKIPSKEFTREYLSPNDIVQLFKPVITRLTEQNKDIKIILTVSPIRHWKDGAIENARSKASLLLSIKELESIFSNIYYFPVYEIFMDELRDYRFYNPDMLHPSEFAIDYIWEIFADNFFSSSTKSAIIDIDKLIKSFEHRPLNTNTESFSKFIEKLKNKTIEFTQKYPTISFEKELGNLSHKFV